jgi:hypothetical protein
VVDDADEPGGLINDITLPDLQAEMGFFVYCKIHYAIYEYIQKVWFGGKQVSAVFISDAIMQAHQ